MQRKIDMKRLYSLIFVRRNTEVLMGRKRRGLGKGLWNGFGGKIEKGETIAEGAARELKEECNLVAEDLLQVGIVTYYVESRQSVEEVHVFTAHKYVGEVLESEEMAPIRWFDLKGMPYESMWPDAPSWIPFLLDGRYFRVDVMYGRDDIIRKIKKDVLDGPEAFLQLCP